MEFKTHVTLHKDGTYSLGVNLDYGFMSPDDMIKLAELAKKHNVRFVHAPEDKILDARAAIARRGIYCEHTTAANYAAYLEYCRLYGKTPDTLITMCGAGLKSDH